MTELLSLEKIMIIVNDYEGNDNRRLDDFDFEYYLDIPEDSFAQSHWTEMSYWKYENWDRWASEERTEWEDFMEEF